MCHILPEWWGWVNMKYICLKFICIRLNHEKKRTKISLKTQAISVSSWLQCWAAETAAQHCSHDDKFHLHYCFPIWSKTLVKSIEPPYLSNYGFNSSTFFSTRVAWELNNLRRLIYHYTKNLSQAKKICLDIIYNRLDQVQKITLKKHL